LGVSYSPSSIVKDAQRHRVEVRPPCVLASAWDSTLEPPPAGSRLPTLRLGLRQIRGFGRGAADAIAQAIADATPTSCAIWCAART